MRTTAFWLATLSLGLALAATDDQSSEMTMDAACRAEIEELHSFFLDWFLGTLDDSDEAFARFADVMDEEFVIVSPAGVTKSLGPLAEGLRRSHGSWRADENDQSPRIWIENIDVRPLDDDLALATYEEWQDVRGEVRGRLSTAVFRRADGTQNGVRWLHVHETWLPTDGDE